MTADSACLEEASVDKISTDNATVDKTSITNDICSWDVCKQVVYKKDGRWQDVCRRNDMLPVWFICKKTTIVLWWVWRSFGFSKVVPPECLSAQFSNILLAP